MSFARRNIPWLVCLGSALFSMQCADDTAPVETATVRAAVSCGAFVAAPSPIRITPAFGDLKFFSPTRAVRPSFPDAPFYVLQQDGIIHRVVGKGKEATSTVFADLHERVAYPLDTAEGGLFGMAFSPDFANNGEVFLSYMAWGNLPNFRRVVTRMKSWDGGVTLDPMTESTVIDIERIYNGHHGGHIAFGPDGYLYVGLGDGRYSDPDRNAQNLDVLLGKILRIDVTTKPYRIPPDNPFVSGVGRPEIYAFGFRNPWSFSFDAVTGDLWLGDVGHGSWEEIDHVTKGANFGWPIREGSHCFSTASCPNPTLVDPVYEYSHLGGAAVSGGYVYRGKAIPELAGHYIFADWAFGSISMLVEDPVGKKPKAQKLFDTRRFIASFAEDEERELYFLESVTGTVFKIERNDAPTAAAPLAPLHLADTGCIDPSDPQKLAGGLIPYDVNLSFWSDDAQKERAFSLPAGGKIWAGPDGTWVFPTGAVTMKTFSLNGRRIETRLMINHPDVGWSGYTYEWNDAQTDATLLEDHKTKTVEGREWTYPGRSECSFCHGGAAGYVLGFQAAQLNRATVSSDGVPHNQLAELEARGVFAFPIDVATAPRLVAPNDVTASLDKRARSWLAVNCGYCHRPFGTGQGPADFRLEVPDPHLCGIDPVAGDRGLTGAKLVTSHAPRLSIVYDRATSRGLGQMPPLGTTLVDPAGSALLEEWIGSGAACRRGVRQGSSAP